MWSWEKKCDKCTTKVEEEYYKTLSAELQAQLDNLQRELSTIKSETADAEFSFDFDRVNAFSVERNWNDGKPVTIIGYMLSEPVVMTEEGVTTKDVVREWYLYCSKEQHAKLVEQFNKAMEKKNAAI